MRKKLKKIPLIILITIIFSLISITPAYASGSIAPGIVNLSTLEQFSNWYNSSEKATLASLTREIAIDRNMTLGNVGRCCLHTHDFTLRVLAGATLILDNEKFELLGNNTLITVEKGAKLIMKNGAIWSGLQTPVIVIEQGGTLILEESFKLHGNIFDKNNGNSPPENLPPEIGTITNIMGYDFTLSCLLGEQPLASDYPTEGGVSYLATENSHEQMSLPVSWELDSVDFNTVGTYTIKGIFTDEVLAEKKLTNPKNFTATLHLTVQKSAPIESLAGRVVSVGSDGMCLVKLALPALAEDVTAIYIYRSADGNNWQRAVAHGYINGSTPIVIENFLENSMTVQSKTYVPYRYTTDYHSIWFRVEIVGSVLEGMSNPIHMEMLLGAKPGDNVSSDGDSDDGSSGGNRGGGGQSEADREIAEIREKEIANATSGKEAENPKIDEVHIGGDAAKPAAPETPAIDGESLAENGGEVAAVSGFAGIEPIKSRSLIMQNPPKAEVKQEEQGDAAIKLNVTSKAEAIQGKVIAKPQAASKQRSRGVIIAAIATVSAAGCFALTRGLYRRRKS